MNPIADILSVSGIFRYRVEMIDRGTFGVRYALRRYDAADSTVQYGTVMRSDRSEDCVSCAILLAMGNGEMSDSYAFDMCHPEIRPHEKDFSST